MSFWSNSLVRKGRILNRFLLLSSVSKMTHIVGEMLMALQNFILTHAHTQWNPSSERCHDRYPLTYPFGMSESSLFPGSFSVCCLILSSKPAASAPWYWSTRTRFLKNRNVGVAEMLLAAAVAWEKESWFCKISLASSRPRLKQTVDLKLCWINSRAASCFSILYQHLPGDLCLSYISVSTSLSVAFIQSATPAKTGNLYFWSKANLPATFTFFSSQTSVSILMPNNGW